MIKRFLFLRFSLLLGALLFIQNSVAQDYTQFSLPEGAKMRLGKGNIIEIAYSPDGTRLAVAGSIGIWLYDAATHQEVALLTGHTDDVKSVVFSPDGRTLASGSQDSTVLLWEVPPSTTLEITSPFCVIAKTCTPKLGFSGIDRNLG